MNSDQKKLPAKLKVVIGVYLFLGACITFGSVYAIKTLVQFQYKISRERKLAEIKLKELEEKRRPKEVLEFKLSDVNVNLVMPRPRNGSTLSLSVVLRTTDPETLQYYKAYQSKIIEIFLEMGREFTAKEIESPQFKLNFKKHVEAEFNKQLKEKAPDSFYFENFIMQ